MTVESVIASVQKANNEYVQSLGFYTRLEEKYKVTQALFSNPMSKDIHLDFEQAKRMFGISFLYAILNGQTAWSVYTGNQCLIKAGFTPSDI